MHFLVVLPNGARQWALGDERFLGNARRKLTIHRAALFALRELSGRDRVRDTRHSATLAAGRGKADRGACGRIGAGFDQPREVDFSRWILRLQRTRRRGEHHSGCSLGAAAREGGERFCLRRHGQDHLAAIDDREHAVPYVAVFVFADLLNGVARGVDSRGRCRSGAHHRHLRRGPGSVPYRPKKRAHLDLIGGASSFAHVISRVKGVEAGGSIRGRAV
jgi:hypothetical protein